MGECVCVFGLVGTLWKWSGIVLLEDSAFFYVWALVEWAGLFGTEHVGLFCGVGLVLFFFLFLIILMLLINKIKSS